MKARVDPDRNKMMKKFMKYSFRPASCQMEYYLEILKKLGIRFKGEGFKLKYNLNLKELELELNKLSKYIFDDDRTIIFNDFRMFPYIHHGKLSKPIMEDAKCLIKNYTYLDLRFIQLIKSIIQCHNERFSFFDVDFLIDESEKYYVKDTSIEEIPIDQIYLIFSECKAVPF